MRYRLLALPLLALITIGCGGGDNKAAPAPLVPESTKTPVVTYDFKEYLVTDVNRKNNYKEVIYDKNVTSNEYREQRTQKEPYEEKYVVDTTNTTMSMNGSDKVVYTFTDKNQITITTKNEALSAINPLVIDRNITVDTAKFIIDKKEGDTNQTTITKCAIVEYVNSKKIGDYTRNDMIREECTNSFVSTGISNGTTAKVKNVITENYYYAKGLGLVLFVKEEDKATNINDAGFTHVVTKIEKSMISTNTF